LRLRWNHHLGKLAHALMPTAIATAALMALHCDTRKCPLLTRFQQAVYEGPDWAVAGLRDYDFLTENTPTL